MLAGGSSGSISVVTARCSYYQRISHNHDVVTSIVNFLKEGMCRLSKSCGREGDHLYDSSFMGRSSRSRKSERYHRETGVVIRHHSEGREQHSAFCANDRNIHVMQISVKDKAIIRKVIVK